MDLKKILTQNSEKFHYVDIPKVFDSIESLSNLDRTKLELTQYPLSNLHVLLLIDKYMPFLFKNQNVCNIYAIKII